VEKYFPGLLNTIEEKKMFFFGGGLPNKRPSFFNIFSPILIQFLIWEMKIQKRVLSALTLDNDFRHTIKGISSYYGKTFLGLNGLAYNVVERWTWARQ
jgi:hypothetical protein